MRELDDRDVSQAGAVKPAEIVDLAGAASTPAKKRRGRPKGSGKKATQPALAQAPPRRRGPAAKTKPVKRSSANAEPARTAERGNGSSRKVGRPALAKKRRGRPPLAARPSSPGGNAGVTAKTPGAAKKAGAAKKSSAAKKTSVPKKDAAATKTAAKGPGRPRAGLSKGSKAAASPVAAKKAIAAKRAPVSSRPTATKDATKETSAESSAKSAAKKTAATKKAVSPEEGACEESGEPDHGIGHRADRAGYRDQGDRIAEWLAWVGDRPECSGLSPLGVKGREMRGGASFAVEGCGFERASK